MQVGVAKTVDRLLGVADQEERVGASAVDRLEDGELQRVGVLELVDQRRREAFPQQASEPGCVATRQAFVQVEQHVVERHDAPLALARAQCRAGLRQQIPQQAQPGDLDRLPSAGPDVEQRLRSIEERVRWGGLRLLGACLQPGLAKQIDLFRLDFQRGHGVVALQHGVPS